MEPILEIKNLDIDYKTTRGKARACSDVSMTIYRGEIVGIIGESGSGKSTLGNGILRTIQLPGKISGGQIIYHPAEGKPIDLLALTDDEYSRHRWTNITTVFQAAQNVFNPTLKVGEHFLETVRAHRPKMSKKEIMEKASKLLKQVRLEERVLDSYPHQLSGGMKQRAIIALSLILRPDLLILDEPTTALDVITQWYILDILRQIHEETGITMVFLTHDVSIIGSVVDRIGVMYSAQLVEYGKVEDVFFRPSHPYTKGLLSAVPSLHDDISKRSAIPGFPPNLMDLPQGCRYGPRCPLVKKKLCNPADIILSNMSDIGKEQYTLCPNWKQVMNDGID